MMVRPGHEQHALRLCWMWSMDNYMNMMSTRLVACLDPADGVCR